MKSEEPAPWVLSISDEITKLSDDKRRSNVHDQGDHGKTCMFLVPHRIWTAGKDDYRVQIIQFGLYNRDKVKMTHMDKVRIDVVNNFMELLHLSWDDLCGNVVGSPDEAQMFLEFYDASLRYSRFDALSAGSILTLDAVFLTVFLCLESYSELRQGQGGLKQLKELRQVFNKVGVASSLHQVFSDVWLLQNQIPLQLIGKVLNLVSDAPSPDALIEATVDKALRRFKLPSPDADVGRSDVEVTRSFQSCTHLLQCLYMTMCPPGELKHRKNVAPAHTAQLSSSNVCWTTLGQICGSWKKHATIPSVTGESPQIDSAQKSLMTVSKLRKAGIRVKGINASVMGIAIERSTFYFTAVLSLPKIHVTVDTRRILRNLCAYELAKSTSTNSQKLICYLSVLDDLINTAEDVRLLRNLRSCVLSVTLPGDDPDQQVADLFNNLLTNYSDIKHTDDLRNLHNDVRIILEDELRNKFIRTVGRVQHEGERFVRRLQDRPWLLISLLAATLLLFMTGIQTVYTVLGYYMP